MSTASGPAHLNNSVFNGSSCGLSLGFGNSHLPMSNGVLQKDTTLTKIFVGGLPYHTTDESLRKFFEQFGTIEEAVVITDRQTGKSRGYGFVTMARSEEALLAIKEPNPCIDGRKANVNLAVLGAKPRQLPGTANAFFNPLQTTLPFPGAQTLYTTVPNPAGSFMTSGEAASCLLANIGQNGQPVPPATSPVGSSAATNPLTAAILNANRCNPEFNQTPPSMYQQASVASNNNQQQALFSYMNMLLAGQANPNNGVMNQHLIQYYSQILASGINGNSFGNTGYSTGGSSGSLVNGGQSFDVSSLFPVSGLPPTTTVSPQNLYTGPPFNRSPTGQESAYINGVESSRANPQQLLRVNIPNGTHTNGTGVFTINGTHGDLQLS